MMGFFLERRFHKLSAVGENLVSLVEGGGDVKDGGGGLRRTVNWGGAGGGGGWSKGKSYGDEECEGEN